VGARQRISLEPASWIWLPSQRTLPNTVVRFRRVVDLASAPVRARGWILADSRYRLFVNGERVQAGPAPADPRWPEADPLDLAGRLHEGQNLLAVEVLHYGSGDGTWPAGKPGLILRLDVEGADGSHLVVGTDASWRCAVDRTHRPGQHRRWYLRALQEECDLRQDEPSWRTRLDDPPGPWLPALVLAGRPDRPSLAARYSDYAWDVQVADPDATAVYARQIPLLRETVVEAQPTGCAAIAWRLPPEDWFSFRVPDAFAIGEERPLEPDADGWITLPDTPGAGDGVVATFVLPVQMVGWPMVELEAPRDAVVEVVVAEGHDPANGPWLDRGFYAWSRLVCPGGLVSWEAFDYESCRWIQLHVHAARAPVRIRRVALRRRQYPWPEPASVRTTEPALQRLVDAEVNMLDNSCQETVVDGMGRERQQYSGDCGYQIRVLRWLHADTALSRRFLTTFSDGLTVEGYFLDTWPAFDRLQRVAYKQVGLAHWGPILDHGLAFCFDCWHYYWETGDLAPLEEVYPRLLRFADYLQSLPRPNGLLPVDDLGLPVVWLDHDAFRAQRHKTCPFNLYVVATCRHALAPLAHAFGDDRRAEALSAFADAVHGATVARFWCPETRCFVDNLPWREEEGGDRYSDYALALAVLYDLCPGGDAARALELLATLPDGVGRSYPANSAWRYRALCRAGRVETVLRDLRTVWATMPSVVYNMTVQEKWHARPDGYDLWGHSAVAPLLILYAGILGLRALAPGYTRLSLTPQLGSLEGLACTAHTPCGPVVLESRRVGTVHEVTLSTPTGADAELRLPRSHLVSEANLPELPAPAPGWGAWRLPPGRRCTLRLAAAERADGLLPHGWRI
jgi:alpha-L-rhamnosidase